MGATADMYRLTFRMLETLDEHFYSDQFSYHWSYSGLGLEPRCSSGSTARTPSRSPRGRLATRAGAREPSR
jgi:hypothetical protein